VIPGNLLTPYQPSPDLGRLTIAVTDPNNGGAGSPGAIIAISQGGKAVGGGATSSDGAISKLLPPGDYKFDVSGPTGGGSGQVVYQTLKGTGGTGTVTKDQITQVSGTLAIPKLDTTTEIARESLRAADLAAAKLPGWAFLNFTTDDNMVLGTGNAPEPTHFAQWCDPNLSTTGDSKVVPGHTWFQDWTVVPGEANPATAPEDAQAIPDNTWWVQALHVKLTGDMAKGTQFVLRDFNMDDVFPLGCVNGVRVGGNNDNVWNANRVLYIGPGIMKTDGSDNLITLVGYEFGGGAGNNVDLGGPNLVAYSGGSVTPPTGGSGDINADGKVNVQDATLSLAFAVGTKTPTDPQKAAGDINGDGKLDIKDATLILKKAVGA
jgi:hypothetical protein